MSMTRARIEIGLGLLLAAVALLMGACATAPPAAPVPAAPAVTPTTAEAAAMMPTPTLESPTRPSLGLFSRIKAPSEVDPVLELAATGVQIFRCELDKDTYRWVFRLPEADLRDASQQVVGHHGANYSFEHVDGSRLIGTIVGYDSAPSGDNALRWLLLRTQSYGQGEFDKMTYVQRVETSGGMPPAQCSAEQVNQILRVPFSAKFIFYRPR
jgi:Protein of unknown function (DUF3455)